jgi:hypothetical protein
MFLEDNQGRRFSDVVNDPDQPFDAVLEFFNDTNRQRRMEESEIHHDRPPLSGVVRELEAHPAIDRSLADTHTHKSKRLRQAVGVVVRMIMQRTFDTFFNTDLDIFHWLLWYREDIRGQAKCF